MDRGGIFDPGRRRVVLGLLAGGAAAGVGVRLRAGEAGRVAADSLRDVRRELVPLIEQALGRVGCPGLALVLVEQDRTLWCEGFGTSDARSGVPVGPGTRFRAGSLAKPLTALAVMQLAAAGALGIDGPLSDHLPRFRVRSRFGADAARITPRMLLCHQSGLPTDLLKGMWTDAPFSRVVDALADEYAAFPPGLVVAYSNLGYVLLGHLVQEIRGRPFDEAMRSALLGPLGMARSGFLSGLHPAPGDALGHRGGAVLDPLPIRDLPAQGLVTCASDLAGLLRMCLSGGRVRGRQVLDPGILESMFEPHAPGGGLTMGQLTGLGWLLEEGELSGCGPVVRHGGSTIGFGAEVAMLPENGLGVAVLANGDQTRWLCAQLADEILVRVAAGGTRRGADLLLDGFERPRAEGPVTGISGAYATDLGVVSITPGSRTLCACASGARLDLKSLGDGWYGLAPPAAETELPSALAPLVGVRFQTRRVSGREVIVARRGGFETVLGERVPGGPLSPAWLARVGRYAVENADPGCPVESFEIKRRGDQLCMAYRMPRLSSATIQVPLGPLSDTEAVVQGLGRSRGDSVRVVAGPDGERIRYSGLIARPLGTASG